MVRAPPRLAQGQNLQRFLIMSNKCFCCFYQFFGEGGRTGTMPLTALSPCIIDLFQSAVSLVSLLVLNSFSHFPFLTCFSPGNL